MYFPNLLRDKVGVVGQSKGTVPVDDRHKENTGRPLTDSKIYSYLIHIHIYNIYKIF